MKNTIYKEFSAGRAGNCKINLLTGALTFVHENVKSNVSVLPINISHVYSSNRADDKSNSSIRFGKGFKLNLQQTLKKNSADNATGTKYVYTDAEGTEHMFEDQYYYFNGGERREYIPLLSDISIDANGKLTYKYGDELFDVYMHQMTESGLTLQSELKLFNGSKKLETRHEQVVQLTEEIFQLKKTIADLKYSVKQYEKNDSDKYNAILDLQREIEKSSINIEGSANSIERRSVEIGKTSIQLENKSITEQTPNKDELLILNNNRLFLNELQESLVSQNSKTLTKKENLLSKKHSYEDAEKAEMNVRYQYLKEIAEVEIQKYTYLMENKEEILSNLEAQIPVNFILGKDNITLGFNAVGNLVVMFDNYDNQVAIIYENKDITKVVDSDNRAIVFHYEKKSQFRGKLVAITDYKGHSTAFSYGANDNLVKVEYPNGETSEFAYNDDNVLTEVLSPSKVGVRFLFNEDKKIANIAEFTKADKVDKNGVSLGTEVAENITTLTYNGKATIVTDVINNITESYLFNADGKLFSMETMQDNKIINFTAYDDCNVSDTNKRCTSVMIADDISVNEIHDIDLLNMVDDGTVAFDGTSGVKKDWMADLTKLDSNHADYFLCGSAIVESADITPKRKQTDYCNDNCEHDLNSTSRRIEYKVLIDYQEKPTVTLLSECTPIISEDNINTLYLNNDFDGFPITSVSSFFGSYYINDLTNYYPILGKNAFNVSSRENQLYYTAKYYAGKLKYGCALWMDDTLLWCNQAYADYNKTEQGWQCAEVNIESWGPIKVHNRDKMFNYAQFLSKDGKFLSANNTNSFIDEFIAGFDYTIRERQYVSLPITLRKQNRKPIMPKRISVFAYFLQDNGKATFEKPILIKGEHKYAFWDESGNVILQSMSEGEKISVNENTGVDSTVKPKVETEYNDNNLPTEKRTFHTYTIGNKTLEKVKVEKWFYNPQGSAIEHWSYVDGEELANGISITEMVYDNRGNAIKSFSYNSLDASTKFYNEQDLAENGRVLAEIDETGEHKTYYGYDDVTGEVKTATAANGSKFSYAHDTNTDDVTAITLSTEDGEANCTNRTYTAGYLTELKSGGNTVNFEYDKKGRTSAVYLNGEKPYVKYEYQESSSGVETIETVTATIAPTDSSLSYTVITESDKKGNLLKVREGRDSLLFSDSIVNTYYTEEDKKREGLLKTSVDKIAYTITEYTYNSLRQPLSAVVRNSVTDNIISNETMEYNEYGQLAKRNLTAGTYSYDYGYNYKDDFAKELQSLDMPYGLSSSQTSDLNGRIKERILTASGAPLMSQCFYYRKHGDHGTSQISSVRYGERRNGEFVIKDGLSYSYDEIGNIKEIKENGKLSVRYGYDTLNRLIREDNVKFGKSTLFTYDNNGNILSKRETPFTLRAIENIVSFTDEKEYGYDAKHPDRLAVYGKEVISRYDAIGNPTEYRGKNLTWQKGRRLTSIYVRAKNETLSFRYDASGRRIEKVSKGEPIKYVYNGDMLIREAPINENNMIYLENDFITGDNSIDGDGVVIDSNKYVLEYIYGQEGVAGLICNGTKYYYRRNINGDISRIYALDGTLKACYNYDAWGNHKVFDASGNVNTNPNFIGNINPFRYRGYYYDTETGLFWVQSRYYDPEVGRFISPDSIDYLDPERINGLNLYSYCGNNPVMNIDPDGHFFFSFLLVLGIAALAGAAVGIGGQFVGDLATSLFTGEWHFSSWEEYLGSAIGGAVGGMLSLIPGFGLGAAIIGGTIGTFSGLAIGKATGSNIMSWGDIGIQTAISFGVNVLTAGITKYARIPGITKGSHSFAQVWNSGVTKVFNHGMSMSLKTAAKGFVSTMVSSFGVSFLLGAGVQGFINAQFIIAAKQRDAYRRKMFPWLA